MACADLAAGLAVNGCPSSLSGLCVLVANDVYVDGKLVSGGIQI